MAERNRNSAEGSENESLLRIPRDLGDENSDLMVDDALEQAETGDMLLDGDDEQNDEDDDEDVQDSLHTLMARLRCLFGALTCPIPPLAIVVALALLHFVGVAVVPIIYTFVRDLMVDQQIHQIKIPDCGGRSLFLYAWLTLVVAMYAPYHMRHRRHDKIVQSLALVYFYFGLVVLQSCNRTQDVANSSTETIGSNTIEAEPPSVCATHCPALLRALRLYVGAMELFTISLCIPLMVLPCVYVWYLRQADHEPTLDEFEERYRNSIHNNTTTVTQVLEQGLRKVQLVERGETVVIVPAGRNASSSTPTTTTRECCICMTDLVETNHKPVVQTKACGHLFHRQCLASWIGRRWEGGRRARRTTCPLCRSELVSSSYGTMR